MSKIWFKSFADVPGTAWEPLVPINERALKHRDATATVIRREDYLDQSKVLEELRWSHGDEWSGSPASRHGRDDEPEPRSPEETAQHVSEVLALPGTPSDYHFSILSACKSLWTARGRDLRALGWIERLCLGDIAMFEAVPGLAARIDTDERRIDIDDIPAFPSFNQLESIYLREGYLAEAAALQERMFAMTGRREGMKQLIDRQAALRSGEAG